MATVTVDHVAFVVASLEVALNQLRGLAAAPGEIEDFPAEGTRECYLGGREQVGRILLMQPTGSGPYAEALEKRGAGLHHVGLAVTDLHTFLLEAVDGSGWYVHPRTFATLAASRTAWLTRPGVEALIEVHEVKALPTAPTDLEGLSIAGLDAKPELARIFGDAIPVAAGPRSGVTIARRFVSSPEHIVPPNTIGDPFDFNREAWNQCVRNGNRWTVPVSPDEVDRARGGEISVVLTPTKPVPREWLGELPGADVLCLASGGGQQGPILAATGANVTVFDASEEQLARDRQVADRDGLEVRTVQGDMRDLSVFDHDSFDLVFHPCSNCFVETIDPVWREVARVLRPGGYLLAGFNNPVLFCFDEGSIERKAPRLRYSLPYRDIEHLDDPAIAAMVARGEAVEFSHTLEAQIGGQLRAGLVLVDFFEDNWGNDDLFPDPYFNGFIATRARKP